MRLPGVAKALLLVALAPAVPGAWALREQHRRISTWVPEPATILRSERAVRRGEGQASVAIRYRFRVGGSDYESDRVYPGPLGFGAPPNLVATYPTGAETSAWHDPERPQQSFLVPHHSFLPYFLLLLASPLVALAAGLTTGGVRHARSGEVQRPAPLRGGWFAVEPFRGWLALRGSAAAALVVFAGFGGFAFVDYFAVASAAEPAAVLLLLAWFPLLVRLAWSVLKRSWVGHRLAEARLQTHPAVPRAGAPFRIRIEQAARRGVHVRALEATLVCERTLLRPTKAGRTRSRKTIALRERAVVAPETALAAGEEIRGEHAFTVPSHVEPEGGFVSWRLEVRTRLRGPDYRTHFPLTEAEED